MPNTYNRIHGTCTMLSFIAPTGYGKTTAALYICKHHNAINLKLAEPLYRIQHAYYNTLGIDEDGRQDGELLQFLGFKIQRDYPRFLSDCFYKETLQCKESYSIITNDDCRPHNYEFLKDMGFKFIGISGVKHKRIDIVPVDNNHAIEWDIDKIYPDYVIDNSGNISDFYRNIDSFVKDIINDA